ncbi:MAG: SIS domain-containing protein [Syntrophobacteraceae bacterium]|nr:SIS domain-containing protein [Syntrophobacteraceae bacterium]
MQPTKKQLLLATERIFEESIEAKQALCRTEKDNIVQISLVVGRAFLSKHRLFLFGNGGSAADAQHLAAEFVNRFQVERVPLPAMALTVDASIVTSIANDYDFDQIFEKQLRALACPGDVVLGLSTSGGSRNVLKALKWARENAMVTIGLAGRAQTEMDLYCDLIVHVPSKITARVQECHITIGHIICAHVDDMVLAAGSRDAAP